MWEPLVTPAPAAWFEEPPPPRPWLLRDARRPKADGLLPLAKAGQLIGEGGASKTQLLLQLAIAVTTATRFIGAFDVTTSGRTFLALGEEDAEEGHRRLYRCRRAVHAPTPEPGAIVVLPLAGVPCATLARDPAGNLYETEFARWLVGWLVANGPWALIVLDPLSRFAGPDAEIDNAAATRFVQVLERIAGATRATVLVAHHTNKAARRGGAVEAVAGRGSSALVDGVRWQCSLSVERLEIADAMARERLGEIVTWSHTKSNYSRRAEPVLLRRDAENGGALVPLDDVDLEIVRGARGLEPVREARQERRDAQTAERDAAEDSAVLQAVRESPGIPLRDLVGRVRALASCGRERAEVAIARVSDRLDVRDGPRRARLHRLRGDS